MSKKNQSHRLTRQHKRSRGVVGIFGREAKSHDTEVAIVADHVLDLLKHEFPILNFRLRKSIEKKEINEAMRKVDQELGQTLFLADACIKPDGGIIEVCDDYGNWRVVLVSEAKHQGKDIENIEAGILVGKKTQSRCDGCRKRYRTFTQKYIRDCESHAFRESFSVCPFFGRNKFLNPRCCCYPSRWAHSDVSVQFWRVEST